jgi:hypothetical protein
MAFLCQTSISDSGGLIRTDLATHNQALRRNINSARGYQRPIDWPPSTSPSNGANRHTDTRAHLAISLSGATGCST